MKVLPFDQGPSEGLTTYASSLKCLPFDHGPDQLPISCQADNPILCQVTEACSFCISDSVFFFALWMMDLSFLQMFWQMFDKIFARIRFLFVCLEKMRSRLQLGSSKRILSWLMGSDRICTALCTYRCMVCPLSTLYLFQAYLLEGNLSRRYDSSRSYHRRCTSEITSPSILLTVYPLAIN